MSQRSRLPRPVRAKRKMKHLTITIPRVVDREIVQVSKMFGISPEKVVGIIIHFRLMGWEENPEDIVDFARRVGISVLKS